MGHRRLTALCIRRVVSGGAIVVGVIASGAAHAGGIYLPGIGAVSTARAGASVASVDNGEALLLNPARLTELRGTQIMVGMSLIDFDLSFQRSGTYDDVAGRDFAWEGQPYAEVHNDSSPAIGFGPYQLIPMLTISTDLGSRIPGLVVAGGVYAPQSSPTRDIAADYMIDDPVVPPPGSRYDIMKERAEFLVANVAAAYRVLPSLDVGARFGVGFGSIEAKSFLWGLPNFREYTGNDAVLDLEASDDFIPTFGAGVSFRPHPNVELAASYTGELSFVGEGKSRAQLSQYLSLAGVPAALRATPDDEARCAKGGTDEQLSTCVELVLPMSATIGGRYKFLDGNGRERADIELDLGWENWGATRASDVLVVVDAQVNGIVTLKDGLIRHGFRDTFSARLGGSYRMPVAGNELIVRGGVSYDTAAAKDGWERLDYDGAARTMLAAGASYDLGSVRIDAGGGAVLEGTRNVGSSCNPDIGTLGCDGTNTEAEAADREGADPINPIFDPDSQNESPMNHGTYSSHYVMFMLGATVSF
jgi:long-subunit fatty acid transport protein